MPGICTNSTRKSGAGCDHRIVTVSLDGESIEVHTGEDDLDAITWDADAKRQFILLGLKYLRERGLTLDQAIGRVTNGEEGNNMKVFPITTKDITKTNVGTAYVNVPIGANGERKFVNFHGCTEFRVRLWGNLVGIGPFGFRIIRDGAPNEVLFENASIALTGERELDTGWVAIPAAFQNEPEGTLVRLQAKSVTAADDPIVRGCDVGVR